MKKKTIIAFEGVDGSGKTSLAKAVAKHLNARYEHNDKSKNYEEGKQKSYEYLEKLKNMEDDILVIDRLVHTGEGVYAPIYRGYDGSDYFKDLEKAMNEEFNILIVYVSAFESTIIKRLKQRGEEYIKVEDLKELVDNYKKYLHETEFRMYNFLNEYASLEKAEEELVKYIDFLIAAYYIK